MMLMFTSENLANFVCGRCLRKQERETVSRAESGRSSLDHYSPPDALIPDLVPASDLTPLQLPAAAHEKDKRLNHNTNHTDSAATMGQRISSLPMYSSTPA